MKKLLLGIGLVMTSCHADRFNAIDAILHDQQTQIDSLDLKLEDKALQLQDNIDNLGINLESVSDDLRDRIETLNIYVDTQDQMILDDLSTMLEETNNIIKDLDDRISIEIELLNSNISATASEVTTINNNINELQAELDLEIAELSASLNTLFVSLEGELLLAVADTIRENLSIELTQIELIITDNTTTGTTTSTVSGTSTGTIVVSAPTVALEIGDYLPIGGEVSSSNGAVTVSLTSGSNTFTPNDGETQIEFTDRIKAWIDAN